MDQRSETRVGAGDSDERGAEGVYRIGDHGGKRIARRLNHLRDTMIPMHWKQRRESTKIEGRGVVGQRLLPSFFLVFVLALVVRHQRLRPFSPDLRCPAGIYPGPFCFRCALFRVSSCVPQSMIQALPFFLRFTDIFPPSSSKTMVVLSPRTYSPRRAFSRVAGSETICLVMAMNCSLPT